MVTASRFEEAQRAPWAHIAWERGNSEIIQGELAQLKRVLLRRCVRDQQSVFFDSQQGSRSPIPRPSRTQNRSWRRARDTAGYSRERRGRRDGRPPVPRAPE